MLLIEKVQEERIVLLLSIPDCTFDGSNDTNDLTRNKETARQIALQGITLRKQEVSERLHVIPCDCVLHPSFDFCRQEPKD